MYVLVTAGRLSAEALRYKGNALVAADPGLNHHPDAPAGDPRRFHR